MKLRAFLAFDMAEVVKEQLGRWVAEVSRGVDGVKWVQPKNLHGTLKFFGNIEEEWLGPIQTAVQKGTEEMAKRPILETKGVGVFPNWRYPKIFWVGFTGDTEAMLHLYQELEQRFRQFRQIPQEKRGFRLHLTLGRARRPIKNRTWLGMLEKMVDLSFGKTVIDHLTLYKSELTREGSIYTELKRFPIAK